MYIALIAVSAFAFVKVAIFSFEGISLIRMVVSMKKMVLKTSSHWIVFPLHKNTNLFLYFCSMLFNTVDVDEAEGQINYHLIEIESEYSNCFSGILTKIYFK